VVAVATVVVAGVVPATAQEAELSDVPPSHPFFEETMWLADQGVTTGYEDGSFRPGEAISREAMAAFFFRFDGASAGAADPGFSDVSPSDPFFDEIAWLAAPPGPTDTRSVESPPMAATWRCDTNGSCDVFVRDMVAGSTERVSVTSSGCQADWDSLLPSISADGRHVAYSSIASNLVPGDTNGVADAFVHDRRDGTTARVSVSAQGLEANDGLSGFTGLVFASTAVSADGRYVGFRTDATNLVPDDANGAIDVLVRDRGTGG
jgi:hypothetical protein